jgi:hypothetical protein
MSKVVLVRGDQPVVETGMTSVQRFITMKPILNEKNRIIEILNDIIFITVKDICYKYKKEDSKFEKYNPKEISDKIVQYIDIYINTDKDKNVLAILFNILVDTFLEGSERTEDKTLSFINTIYMNVMELISEN